MATAMPPAQAARARAAVAAAARSIAASAASSPSAARSTRTRRARARSLAALEARPREGKARPLAGRPVGQAGPRRRRSRGDHRPGARQPHGREGRRPGQGAVQDGHAGHRQPDDRPGHRRAAGRGIRPQHQARLRKRRRHPVGGRCRCRTRRCSRVRRWSRSWAMSITARPRCSTRCAAPTWSRARPAASPSTSAPIR